MPKLFSTLLCVLLVTALSTAGLAVPQLIDYQGFLEDDNGSPITDTLSVTFTIYTASTGGSSKWTETQSSVAIIGGLFNVSLGASTAILDTVFNDDTRYLAITIGGTELTPRTRIVSSAYAHRVNTIDGADGGTVAGAITAGKGNFGSGNTNTGTYAFVAGRNNSVSGSSSTIGGGERNNISFSSTYGSITGGYDNNITSSAYYSTIVGGGLNEVNSGDYATIAAGYNNYASGDYSTVIGGANNSATNNYAFAAGQRAKAISRGSFVWADSYAGDFSSTAADQFSVRSSGGVRIYTNSGLTAGVTLSAGGSSWNSVSDSTLKKNIRTVRGSDILEKLMKLPVKQWSYKAQNPSIEHIGPMAQDFYSIFDLGENDVTISTIDPSGIALVAIQEVYRLTQQLQNKVKEIDDLKAEMTALQMAVRELAQNSGRRDKASDNLAQADSQDQQIASSR